MPLHARRFLSAVCLLAASVFPLQAGAIVGGKPAGENDAPWMAAIIDTSLVPSENCLDSGGSTTYCQQVCGGTLIAPSWVLTAAHCLIGRNNMANLRVVVGETDLNAEDIAGSLLEVTSKHEHPLAPTAASTVYRNDIALLRLTTPAPVTPASLGFDDALETLDSGGATAVDDEVEVIGWGQLGEGKPFPNLLQRVALDLLRASCAAQYALIPGGYDTSIMICAGEENAPGIEPDDDGDPTPRDEDGEDACVLDSGGPLITRDASGAWVVGVVSWGQNAACGDPAFPGVYARAPAYASWIESTTSGAGDALSDLAVAINGNASANASTSVSVTLRNRGTTNAVTGAGLTLTYSGATLNFNSGSGMTCTAGTGVYNCTRTGGTLGAGQTASASFTASGTADSVLLMSANTVRTAGTHDYRSGNDRALKTVAFTAQPDLRAGIDAVVTEAFTGDSEGRLWITVSVRNASAHVIANSVAFTLTVPAGHALTDSDGLTCTGTTTLSCTVGTLATGGGDSWTLAFDGMPHTNGTATLAATAGNGNFPEFSDADFNTLASDNAAVTYVEVDSEPEPGGKGGGGGGGLSAAWLMLAGGLLALRRRARTV
ncbi:MAG: serine protease [Pseudomonadota bacterium]